MPLKKDSIHVSALGHCERNFAVMYVWLAPTVEDCFNDRVDTAVPVRIKGGDVNFARFCAVGWIDSRGELAHLYLEGMVKSLE